MWFDTEIVVFLVTCFSSVFEFNCSDESITKLMREGSLQRLTDPTCDGNRGLQFNISKVCE